MMGEGDLSRGGVGVATQEAGIANGVMRGPKGTLGDECLLGVELSDDAVDLGGFEGFLKCEGWKDGGESFGKHRFARAGRAD